MSWLTDDETSHYIPKRDQRVMVETLAGKTYYGRYIGMGSNLVVYILEQSFVNPTGIPNAAVAALRVMEGHD